MKTEGVRFFGCHSVSFWDIKLKFFLGILWVNIYKMSPTDEESKVVFTRFWPCKAKTVFWLPFSQFLRYQAEIFVGSSLGQGLQNNLNGSRIKGRLHYFLKITKNSKIAKTKKFCLIDLKIITRNVPYNYMFHTKFQLNWTNIKAKNVFWFWSHPLPFI